MQHSDWVCLKPGVTDLSRIYSDTKYTELHVTVDHNSRAIPFLHLYNVLSCFRPFRCVCTMVAGWKWREYVYTSVYVKAVRVCMSIKLCLCSKLYLLWPAQTVLTLSSLRNTTLDTQYLTCNANSHDNTRMFPVSCQTTQASERASIHNRSQRLISVGLTQAHSNCNRIDLGVSHTNSIFAV